MEDSGENNGVFSWYNNGAKTYVDECNWYGRDAIVNSNVGDEIVVDGNKLPENVFGPFAITYAGTISIDAYDDKGQKVSNIGIYTDSACTTQSPIATGYPCGAGTTFYIKTNGEKLSSITVKAKGGTVWNDSGTIKATNQTVHTTDIWFIRRTGYDYGQRFMIVKPGEKIAEDECTIKINYDKDPDITPKPDPDPGDDIPTPTPPSSTGVVVHKIDSDGSGHGVEGASFTLYHHNYYRVYTEHYYEWEYDYTWHCSHWDYSYDSEGEVTGWYYTHCCCEDIYKWVEYTQTLPEVKNYKYTPNSGSAPNTWYSLDSERDVWEAEGSGTTDKNGYASLGTIDTGQNGEYTECYVEETNLPPGYQKAVEPKKYFSVSKSGDASIELENVKNKTTVNKLDIDTKEGLSGIKFELYSGSTKCKFLTDSPDGYYNYDKYSGTTTIEAKNGKILLGRLPSGTYKLKEIETKKEYELYILKGDEDPYMPLAVSKKLKPEYDGIPSNGEVTVYNKKKMSISGFVWEDQSQGKVDGSNGGYDSKYNNSERKISGVTVILKETSGKEVARTTTDGSGKYKFENIVYHEDYNKYYVEFNYSNLFSENTRYIPVALGESLGLCEAIDGHDRSVPSTATTNKGGLSKDTYDEDTNTLKNINLGLKKLAPSSFTVKESIEYVEIKLNGYTQIYYINSDEDPGTTAPGITTVQVQDAKEEDTYSHKLYPSEIVYDRLSIKNTGEEKLIVDVIYRIDITNTTTTHIDELYREDYLNVTSLVNKFDNRFILPKDEDDEINKNWNKETETSTTAELNEAGLASVSGISPNGVKKINIRLRLTPEAKKEILDNPNGVSVKEATTVDAEGYHIYNRKEYGWSYNTTRDPNSHQTFTNYAHAKAQYINFQLGQEREITGTTFEDTNVRGDTNEVVGDGMYVDSEKKASGVKVELVEIDPEYKKKVSELLPTTLYSMKKSGDVYLTGDSAIKMDSAQTFTDENGEYTLTGMIPGEYYLRFTYGNGTQKLVDSSGSEITSTITTKVEDKEITTEDYKSTIVNPEKAKSVYEALKVERGEAGDIDADKKAKDNKSWQWYKPENMKNETNANVAVDDLEYNNGDVVSAATPRMSIGVENTTGETKVYFDNNQIETIEGMNFGIITKPQKSVEYEKLITNVWIRNGQNSKLIDGNPAKASEPGMSNLDKDHTDGSVFVRVELPEDQIYSSTVVLTYRIRVTNTSDVDYYNKYYPWFGISDPDQECTLIVDEAYDYFDPKMKVSGDLPEDLKELAYKDKKWVKVEDGAEFNEGEIADDIKDTYQSIIHIQDNKDNGRIYTNKNTDRTEEKQNRVNRFIDYVFKTENTLPTEEDDMDFVNRAVIKKVKNSYDYDDGKYNDKDAEHHITFKKTPVSEPNEVSATLTITPPTGENKQLIFVYTVTIVISLLITSAGVIFIKKKVL